MRIAEGRREVRRCFWGASGGWRGGQSGAVLVVDFFGGTVLGLRGIVGGLRASEAVGLSQR